MDKTGKERKVRAPVEKTGGSIDIGDTQRLNKSLLEESLVLAATQHGVNEDYDMEERERAIEAGPAAVKKAKK